MMTKSGKIVFAQVEWMRLVGRTPPPCASRKTVTLNAGTKLGPVERTGR